MGGLWALISGNEDINRQVVSGLEDAANKCQLQAVYFQ